MGSLVVRASDSRPEDLVPCQNCGGGDRWCGHLSSLLEFHRDNSYCHLYGGQGQQQAYEKSKARIHRNSVCNLWKNLLKVVLTEKDNEEHPGDVSGLPSLYPFTNLTRGLAARRKFKVPPYRKGTIHLQTSTSSPGVEPRPYSTAVSLANHCTGCVNLELYITYMTVVAMWSWYRARSQCCRVAGFTTKSN
ncbi:hypothetical protein TNCV_4806771 [Trichonephila clavipes]|nr:hypothetical protein TNCV_4806771 [Trichonephila clavipes]